MAISITRDSEKAYKNAIQEARAAGQSTSKVDREKVVANMSNGLAGSKGAATGQAAVDNDTKLQTDPAFADSEKIRAQGVIDANQGKDTSIQQSYIDKINGYQPVTTEKVSGPTTEPRYNYAGEINNMYDQRQTAEMDAIRKQRETALQGYNKMETQTKDQAYDNRNQADVASMQNAQRLRESMVNAGILNSGDNITATAGLNSQRQGAIGSINRDESNILTDIGERRNMVVNNAASDESSLISKIAADRIQSQINQQNSNRQFDLQEGGLMGQYGGQRTLAGQQFDYNTSPTNPQNVGQALNNQIAELKLQNLPQEIKLGLEALQQDIKTGALNQQQAELKLKELQDPNSITNRSNELALEAARLGNVQLQKQIEQIGKVPALTDYEKQMQNLKLEAAKVELQQAQNPGSNVGFTQGQVKSYNELFDAYTRDGRDPAEGFQYLSSPEGRMAAMKYGLNEPLYEQMVGELKNRIPEEVKLNKNQVEANYYTNLDDMTEDKKKEFFKNEKSNIIGELGVSGWEKLKQDYDYYE